MKNKIQTLHIYTDGACDNTGTKQGSWGFVIVNQHETRIIAEKSAAEDITTNNRMEMRAAIESIKHFLMMCLEKSLNPLDFNVVIHSDSQYVVKGMNEWSNNWIKKDFKDVKNSFMWMEMIELSNKAGGITFKWVKAHVGNKWNEYADALCSKLCERADYHLKHKKGYSN